MDSTSTQDGISTTLAVLAALIPVATTVTAMVGGVPVPVTQGLAVAQALLPVVSQFMLQVGTHQVAISTEQANDPKAIMAALQKDAAEPWPVLSFAPSA